ncbi:hypothetical protein [Streptomyces alboflavus]|uniref:hypothetical protein n=1 Tax=Streptomyces alboflavus TaxID=67267 RepID=UPI0036CD2935
MDRIVYGPLFLLVAAPLSLMITFGSARSSGACIASVFTVAAASMWRIPTHRILAARAFYVLLVASTVWSWTAVVRAQPSPAASPTLFLSAVVFLGLISAPVLMVMQRRLRKRALEECHPYDPAVVWAIRAAHVVHENRQRWNSSLAARGACNALENLAVEVARDLSMADRVDPGDSRLRAELRTGALRVAESVRQHKRTIATASSEDDMASVVRSLTAGAEALAKKDRAALLDGAPELSAGVDRIRLFVRGAIPAFGLIALAFVLPLIPGVAAHPDVASTLRWTLLVLGVTTLVTSSPELAGRVTDVFGKAMPFK